MPKLNAEALSPSGRHLLAFSGGPDSTCLLGLLHRDGLARDLRVVHVDHGLDPESGQRADRARQIAESLGSACEIHRIEIRRQKRDGGLESAARRRRYACLAAMMRPDEYLLTAHHADDQAETVLLRLLRGAGPEGLAGMRSRRRFAPGWLGRPLLDWRREQIDAVIAELEVQPLSDPSNLDHSRDRNYLRHRVLPVIADRWPGYRRALARSAERQRNAADAVRRQARRDWESLCRRRDSGEVVLDRRGWLDLERAAALEVLRYWCSDLASPPPTARLEAFHRQCGHAAPDSQPRLAWDHACMHAWADRIWLDVRSWSPPAPTTEWSDPEGVAVPAGGRLVLQPIPDRRAATRWTIGPVASGARLRLEAEGPNRKVTELLRRGGIPPWRRPALPALYSDGTLRAVATDWLDHELSAWLGARGSRLRWHDQPAALLPCRGVDRKCSP